MIFLKAEVKQQPPSQPAEETLYAEPILVNQSKPNNPLGRIYAPLGKKSTYCKVPYWYLPEEEIIYVEPILVNQSKPNPLGRITPR
jgi:hypothetical protein